MWYTECQQLNKGKEANPVDYKLVANIADKIIRNRLLLKGEYNPKVAYINKLIQKVYNSLQDRYGEISVIRSKTTDEYLTPMVISIIDDILG